MDGDQTCALKNHKGGTSLVVQRLRPHTASAGGLVSTPGWGIKIPHATRHSQKIQKAVLIK